MILEVVIKYDPYHKATYMTVDGLDVTTVPDSAGYGKFRKQIEKKVPIQTWLEKRGEWRGILNELISEQSSDNLTFNFSGRKIDFDDLRHACESQNEERGNFRCNLKFNLEYEITDEQMARNIEEVVGILQSDRFRKLVEESRLDPGLEEKYKNFKSNYDNARNAEFTITVAGIFSSGKSTIINSLIRHNALPVDQDTCTKKICKIRDNTELKLNELKLLIYDNDKKLIREERFSDDDKAVNDKKCSKLISDVKSDPVGTILEVNLGHLYPNDKSREMFKLVIIDTPGTDSNESDDGKGHNADEDIALDAVFKSNGDMVILSIKAGDVDSEGLSRLVKGISGKFDKDSDVYNDRFLFVVNQCDLRTFTPENTTTDFINRYRKKLKELTKNQSFIPRIFPLCAAVPGALYAGDEVCKKNRKPYSEKVFGYVDEYEDDIVAPNPFYYFYEYCDVPQYMKKNYEKKFKTDDRKKALLISSGFVCLEDAIKDYVERFAYPIRIDRILKTYETIPGSVINCIKAQEQMLKKQRESLETAQDEGKAAEEKEKEEKKKADKLAKAKSVIEKLKGDVEDCTYDASALFTASRDLCTNVDRLFCKYKYGEMDYDKVCEVLPSIQESVEHELDKFSELIINCGKAYMCRIDFFIDKIELELKKLKDDGILDLGGFDFSESSVFAEKIKIDFGNIDIGECSAYRYREVPNPEKYAYCDFWDLVGHIKKAFAKKTIIQKEHIVNMDELFGAITTEIYKAVGEARSKINESYKKYAADVQNAIIGKLCSIDNSLSDSKKRLDDYEKGIVEKYTTAESLKSEIVQLQSRLQWLTKFNEKVRSTKLEMMK